MLLLVAKYFGLSGFLRDRLGRLGLLNCCPAGFAFAATLLTARLLESKIIIFTLFLSPYTNFRPRVVYQ